MTQTATFPDLEGHPGLSDQAVLYFAATMGMLTEVDVVTSGSFEAQFSAENLAPTGRTIVGTTSGNLSINVPTGATPVMIPPVSQSFNASAFDGTLDYGGTSGETMAPVTSSSTPQTTVLTSPADLAAFTGHFRIPIAVSGRATGSTSPADANVSATFQTDTSATITVIYHFIPNLPGLDPAPASPTSPPGGTSAAPIPSSSAVAGAGVQAATTRSVASSARAQRVGPSRARISPHPHPFRRHTSRQPSPSHRQGPDAISVP
jgi:hypothetical protein